MVALSRRSDERRLPIIEGERPMSLKLELLAAICLISFEPPTEAHDIYSPLKDRWGNSCCNDQDCRPVALPGDASRGANARQWQLDRRAGPHDPVSGAARGYR